MPFRPRPYQERAVEAFVAGAAGGLDSMLHVVPTGGGKTAIGLMTARKVGGRSLWLANRCELLEQAIDQAQMILPGSIGKIVPRFEQSSREHIFASIDTIKARLSHVQGWPPFDFVVVDEVHHLRSPGWERAVGMILERSRGAGRKPILCGLTATVERGDGRTLGKWFQAVAFEMSMDDAIEQGALVPWVIERAVLPRVTRKLSDGDIDQVAAAADWERTGAAKLVAKETASRLGTRKVIVFVPDVRQAQKTAAALRTNGVAADWTSGAGVGEREGREARAGDGERARRDKRRAFREGKTRAMCVASLWLEGFDDRTVGMIVMGRHTTSPVVYRQAVGRGLRATLPEDHYPKKDCLVLDLVGAHEGIGLQTAACLRSSDDPESEGLRVLSRCRERKTFDPDPGAARVRSFLEKASTGTPARLFWERKAPWRQSGPAQWALPTGGGAVVLDEVTPGRWTAAVVKGKARAPLGTVPLPTRVAQAVAEEVARSMAQK